MEQQQNLLSTSLELSKTNIQIARQQSVGEVLLPEAMQDNTDKSTQLINSSVCVSSVHAKKDVDV